MHITDTKYTSAGTQFTFRCWCGGKFTQVVAIRQARQTRHVTCPQCGHMADLRVVAEIAAMGEGAENDFDRRVIAA